MVRSAAGASPDDALHRSENHEGHGTGLILRDAAKTLLLRMRFFVACR
jgi:hypothetical protein